MFRGGPGWGGARKPALRFAAGFPSHLDEHDVGLKSAVAGGEGKLIPGVRWAQTGGGMILIGWGCPTTTAEMPARRPWGSQAVSDSCYHRLRIQTRPRHGEGPVMYLEHVHLRNIACFEDLTLDLTREGNPCPWVVLLGENGSGKSTLLQMIALSLLGGEMIHEIAGGVEWGRFARSGAGSGRIFMTLKSARGDIVPPPRILLGYADADQQTVEALSLRLAELGFWTSMEAIDKLSRQQWKQFLRKALRDVDLVVVCLSNHLLANEPLGHALDSYLSIQQGLGPIEIDLIPVRLEPCELPPPSGDPGYIDIFQEGGFDCLVERIHAAMALRQYLIGYELGAENGSGLRDTGWPRRVRVMLDHSLYSRSLTDGWFACAYGPWRRLSPAKVPNPSSQALNTSRRKSHRFATMFEEESALTLVNDWLIDLEFRRLKDPKNETAQRIFDLAKNSIERMLPDVRFRAITPEGEVVFEESGVEVPIHSLSDGYRSTLAWVGDLVRRLVDASPEADDPLAASGVVLVDEIDLHLHPKWQCSIVDEVRLLFPNLQFVVSSHSPFVAQDVGEADKIIVLRKEEGRVVAQEGLESVKGWRVDQILTSYLFDLESTRDASLAALEQEYRSLLDRQARGEAEEADTQRVRELRDWLERHKSAPGETVAENELFDAARSFIDLVDRQLVR